MLFITCVLPVNIVIHKNVIQSYLSLDDHIKQYIRDNILYNYIKEVIPVELLGYKYDYPIILPCVSTEGDLSTVYVEATFRCIFICREMLLSGVTLSPTVKITEHSTLIKTDYNITFTCIDTTTTDYLPEENYTVLIKMINYTGTGINLIVEKYSLESLYFKIPKDDKINYLTAAIIDNIDKNYKFRINQKLMNIEEVVRYVMSLKKNTLYSLNVSKKNITIVEDKSNITIPTLLYNNYLNTALLHLYNYYKSE